MLSAPDRGGRMANLLDLPMIDIALPHYEMNDLGKGHMH